MYAVTWYAALKLQLIDQHTLALWQPAPASSLAAALGNRQQRQAKPISTACDSLAAMFAEQLSGIGVSAKGLQVLHCRASVLFSTSLRN